MVGRFIEWFFRTWVRLFGRRVRRGEMPWLDGPLGSSEKIGADYYQKLIGKASVTARVNEPGAGLMRDFQRLKSASFDPQQVDQRVRDFYERTTDYRLDVWSQWSTLFRPFAWLLVSNVSRRIQQLNLPISPLETSRGMSSDVIQLADEETGEILYTCWLRKVLATGDVVYAGFYSTCQPPNYDGECVKVSFPLPQGNATVVLKPIAHPDGSLELKSSGWSFGDPGYYRIHQTGEKTLKVRLIRALKESIRVYVDESGTLRTDHIFSFWRTEMLRLHYKIMPVE
ncbi:MAG: hypothetical protein JO360_12800 [Acidobacteria bacterium]|nr:hypothetical protein [Acidobacteriota bacterium]